MRTITKNRWTHARILQRGVFIPTRFDGLTVSRSTASGANIAVQFSCYRCALLVGCSGGARQGCTTPGACGRNRQYLHAQPSFRYRPSIVADQNVRANGCLWVRGVELSCRRRQPQ